MLKRKTDKRLCAGSLQVQQHSFSSWTQPLQPVRDSHSTHAQQLTARRIDAARAILEENLLRRLNHRRNDRNFCRVGVGRESPGCGVWRGNGGVGKEEQPGLHGKGWLIQGFE